MSADFSRIITLLRKERNISQKTAAADLGVSQGLLSHYEKGKRECGLDFLVKIANYYDVSCDYLLGRSPEPEGKTFSVNDIPDDELPQRDKFGTSGIMLAFNKKLVGNSTNLLFSLAQRSKSDILMKEVSSYLMLSVYQMLRVIYSSNVKNDENFFTVPKIMSVGLCDAAMNLSRAKIEAVASGFALDEKDSVSTEDLAITTDSLSREYSAQYSSTVNLIKNCEARIKIMSDTEK